MAGKPRGGKRLKKSVLGDGPLGWAVVLLVVVALIYTGVMFSMGREEAQRMAQNGPQATEGGRVVSFLANVTLSLYGPEMQAGSVSTSPEPVAWTEDDLALLAQTVYAEADICRTTAEKAAVVWCVLNRLDTGRHGDSIREVVTAPHQFAWSEDRPVVQEYIELAEDVLERWAAEKAGQENVGRVLPAEYLFFEGDGWENHFTTTFPVGEAAGEWAWTLPDPYREG